MQTELNSPAKISCLKFNGYKIDLSTNIKGHPVAKLHKFITVGKNKGTYKQLEGYRFSDENRRKEWITEKIKNIKGNIQSNEDSRKAGKDAISNHPFKVGQALYQSWGYDQTNIDFYQIVEVKEKTVKVREIGQVSVPGSNGYMCEHVMPDIDKFIGEVESKLIKAYISTSGDVRYYIVNGRHSLTIYSAGKTGTYQSHYA